MFHEAQIVQRLLCPSIIIYDPYFNKIFIHIFNHMATQTVCYGSLTIQYYRRKTLKLIKLSSIWMLVDYCVKSVCALEIFQFTSQYQNVNTIYIDDKNNCFLLIPFPISTILISISIYITSLCNHNVIVVQESKKIWFVYECCHMVLEFLEEVALD